MYLPVAIMLLGLALLGIFVFAPSILKIEKRSQNMRIAFILVSSGLIVVGGLLGYLRYNVGVADNYFATGQYEEGLAIYQKLAKIDGDNPTFLNGIAFGQYQTGDFDSAYDTVESSLDERSTDNYDASMIKAWVETIRGNSALAITTLEAIATSDVSGSYAFYEIAMLEYNQGNMQQAIDACKKAIEYNPEYFSAYDSLANFYSIESRYADTAAVYQLLIAADLVNPGQTAEKSKAIFSYNKGVAFYYDEQYQKAIDSFLEALEVETNVDAMYYLASCYVLAGDSEQAITTLEQMLELDPSTISFVESDIDFNALYDLPEFQTLLLKYR